MTTSIIPVLESRIPEFARESYPYFVKFIKDYLTWLEQDDNFLGIANNWQHNMEPSNDVEPYVSAILRDLGFDVAQDLSVPKSVLLHFLRDFYLSRGTETSFKFLFRALFNSPVEIRYPREEMLIPSIANYASRSYIFTSASNRNIREFTSLVNYVREYSGELVGLTSEARTSIENISIVYGQGMPYLLIEILAPLTEFQVGEQVNIIGNITISEQVKPVLSIKIKNPGSLYQPDDLVYADGPNLPGRASIAAVSSGGVTGVQIDSPGAGYQVGDRIYASSLDNGWGFNAYVTEVDANGGITQVRVSSKGYSYETLPMLQVRQTANPAKLVAISSEIGAITRVQIADPFVDFDDVAFDIVSDFGSGAVLEAEQVSRYETREWLDRRGVIAEASTIIDSDKYQQFSYTIVSPIPADRYDAFVDDLLHPAGYIRTSTYEIYTAGEIEVVPGGEEDQPLPPFVYIGDLVLTLEGGYGMDVIEQDIIVTDLGDPIITDVETPILYTKG
ncbi:hypothetical protein CPT_Mendera_299 [Stenotrophomonas phage Mendera]|uniref:Baseplate wedge protein n=1 Tax=Stenotrophomonas phage Mendera TaxID=2650877 RepID=A0A5P8PJK3_9CAUD|nr:hypothetical protein HWC60_gp116 [Stenotrophomonas phage Mendera]QFR56825.1 hypothetical protein CPT_Mendera_299 [Stenotrophomonas phage Mendera]